MSTLLIRVEHPPPGERLVVRGYRVQHGDLGWHEDLGAEKELPRELPPLDGQREPQAFEEVARQTVMSAGSAALRREVGRQLWRLIAEGAVGAWWAQEVEAAGVSQVRTILDVRPPELKSLPWELMTPDLAAPVFRDERHPWVRACAPWAVLEELPVPVRMLVVVGDRTSPDLKVDDELDAIHGCVRDVSGSWHIDILMAPTMRTLRERYDAIDPHILHIIGHAGVRNDQYVLTMSPRDPGRRQWSLTVEDVAELPTPAPRLVVLNCCRTSAATAEASSWTFTDAFIQLGSAAVVTMQGDIPSRASVAFTSTFYRDLVVGTPIDMAAARARLQISMEMRGRQNDEDRCWALPSLSVVTDPDRVLPVRASISQAELDVPPYDTAFSEVSGYLDRSMERRLLLRSLDPEPHRWSPPLLLLVGERSVGRSAVVRSAFLTLRLRGCNAVYVNLDAKLRDRKLSWLSVLRRIRDELWEWNPSSPAEARLRFDHELAHLKEHSDPEPWSPATGRSDDGAEFPSEGEHYLDWIEKILVAFRRMLAAVARSEPLLLALDSLRAVHGDDVRDVLAEHLFLPLAEGLPQESCGSVVRCLVTGDDEEMAMIPEHVRRRLGSSITVEPFEPEEVPRLVHEYLARRALVPTKEWTERVDYILLHAPRSGWKPGDLGLVLRGLEVTLSRR